MVPLVPLVLSGRGRGRGVRRRLVGGGCIWRRRSIGVLILGRRRLRLRLRATSKVPFNRDFARIQARKELEETWTHVHVSIIAVSSPRGALRGHEIRPEQGSDTETTHEVHDCGLCGLAIGSDCDGLAAHRVGVLLRARGFQPEARLLFQVLLTTSFIATVYDIFVSGKGFLGQYCDTYKVVIAQIRAARASGEPIL